MKRNLPKIVSVLLIAACIAGIVLWKVSSNNHFTINLTVKVPVLSQSECNANLVKNDETMIYVRDQTRWTYASIATAQGLSGMHFQNGFCDLIYVSKTSKGWSDISDLSVQFGNLPENNFKNVANLEDQKLKSLNLELESTKYGLKGFWWPEGYKGFNPNKSIPDWDNVNLAWRYEKEGTYSCAFSSPCVAISVLTNLTNCNFLDAHLSEFNKAGAKIGEATHNYLNKLPSGVPGEVIFDLNSQTDSIQLTSLSCS